MCLLRWPRTLRPRAWQCSAPSRNEIAAFALTLAAYVAARGLTLKDLPALRSAVVVIAGAVTAIGTPLTAHALLAQWDDSFGRAIVLGLPSAATMLTMVLGFVVIAAATAEPTWRQLVGWCAALFLPIAIASASMVRFTLIATLGATLAPAGLATTPVRRRIAIAVALTVAVAATCGLAARHQTAAKFLRQITELADSAAHLVIPAANAATASETEEAARIRCNVDTDSSLAIRKALLNEAIAMIPQAGPFGLGLDAFARRSCLGMPPHNTLLQATIELGWIGGALLAILFGMTALRLVPIARSNPAAAFLLCALAYVAAISMVHGRLSRDVGLFLLLGAGAGAVPTAQWKTKWKPLSGSWPVRPLF